MIDAQKIVLYKKKRFIILSQDTITDSVILSAKLGLESQNIYCFPEELLEVVIKYLVYTGNYCKMVA